MADVSKTVSIIFEGENRIGDALRGVEGSLDSIGTTATGTAGSVEEVGNEVEALSEKGRLIDSVAEAFRALATAVVVKAFVDANIEAEKFDRAMTLLKGSTEAAAGEFQYISRLAEQLGLQIFTTADAYVSLTASTRGTALEGQATRDIFEAVAVAMSSLGKSSADTEGALLAVSQMVSKGTVSMEELRGQLGERLPGAFGIAAEAMGLTTEELDALVSSGSLAADDFLPKFAAALQKTFGDVSYIETYQASWNRLQNSINESFITLGNAGVFDALTKGLETATASVAGLNAAFVLIGEVIGILFGALSGLKNEGNLDQLGDELAAAMERAADKTRGASDALLDAESAAVDLKYAGEQAGAAVETGMKDAALSAEDLARASKAVDAALKTLGIDPKTFIDPVAEIVSAFESLASNPAVTGEQFLSGLLVTLDKIKDKDDILTVLDSVNRAYDEGRISAEQYAAAINAVDSKETGAWEAMIRTTDQSEKQSKALEKQASEARKVEEATAKMALELEKLASNERIALIEANVALNVAQVEADTARIQSAFESIDNAITSTGDTLVGLTEILGGSELGLQDWKLVRDEIERESNRRDEAFKKQGELIDAQIKEIEARADALERGDAMIQIDGAGLQPHLEAFMWEILRAIQVRVNQDGYEMLVGA